MKTVSESANDWKVLEDTVWKYIRRGYIFGIKVQRNELLLPEIRKPYVPTFAATKDKHIDSCIIKALDRHGYLNKVILGVSVSRFNERITALLHAGLIIETDCSHEDMCASTAGYALAATGGKALAINVNAVKIDAGVSVGPNINVVGV